MKRLIPLFFFFICSVFYSQNIGIVSNINPKLGYSHTKAGIKFNPIFENDLDYNLQNFIDKTFTDNNKSIQELNDFDWRRLGFFDEFTKTSPILDYLKTYCETNKIDELFIVRKVNSFKLIGPMDMFFNFSHNFGIMTFPGNQKRALMYYNFGVYKYNLKDNKIYTPVLKKDERMDIYLNKTFDNPIYGEDKILKDKTVPNYFLPIFENFMKNSFTKLLIQNPKETSVFMK